MEDLRQQLQVGIAYRIRQYAADHGQRNAHAVVVVVVGSAQLTIYDPLDGERVLPQATFLTPGDDATTGPPHPTLDPVDF